LVEGSPEVIEIEFAPIGELLCTETALAQAAQALDIASEIAIGESDTDSLLKIAALWADVSDRLGREQEDGGQPKTPGTNDFKTGFST